MLEIASFVYRSGQAGPAVLMFGAVHGNETCGTVALARLKLELELGIVALRRGTLTLAPVCNPLAYRAGRRYIHENLNRIIAPGLEVTHPERGFGQALVRMIDDCDVLLDLHSYSAGTLPFISYDYDTPANRAIAESFGIAHWVTGWRELYASAPGLNEGDTIQYANETGKTGVLVECGQHNDPAAAAVAYTCARQTLAQMEMIDPLPGTMARPAPIVTKYTSVIVKDREGVFARDWQTFDTAAAGEPLIHYADGEMLRAERDSIVILPDPIAPVGAEWIYLAERCLR
jgi:predicted deacylase